MPWAWVLFVFLGMISGGGTQTKAVTNTNCHHEVVGIVVEVDDSKSAAIPQDGAKRCERPSKDNPEVGETDPNKRGCTCEPTCVDGRRQEYSGPDQSKRCKNHCHPSECDCPDPCKT